MTLKNVTAVGTESQPLVGQSQSSGHKLNPLESKVHGLTGGSAIGIGGAVVTIAAGCIVSVVVGVLTFNPLLGFLAGLATMLAVGSFFLGGQKVWDAHKLNQVADRNQKTQSDNNTHL